MGERTSYAPGTFSWVDTNALGDRHAPADSDTFTCLEGAAATGKPSSAKTH